MAYALTIDARGKTFSLMTNRFVTADEPQAPSGLAFIPSGVTRSAGQKVERREASVRRSKVRTLNYTSLRPLGFGRPDPVAQRKVWTG